MTLTYPPQRSSVSLAQGRSPESLNTIHQPDCAAAVWQRGLQPEFLDWIRDLPPEQLPRGRFVSQVHMVRATVTRLCETSGLSPCPERHRLVDDISELAQIFSTLMSSPVLRVRLEAIDNNACRKFHIDAVSARLICTYRGQGTQLAASRSEERTPHQIASGDPLVLRGTRWRTQADNTMRHRSPPIAGTGETRLLLVIDAAADWGTVDQRAHLHS